MGDGFAERTRTLAHRGTHRPAGGGDELSKGDQGLLHAHERRRQHRRRQDVLAPGIGEIIGGSQREERLDVLDARLEELDLEKDDYWWYRDLRKYGTVPHAGFGLGFERTLIYATGMANVRDVIPFPRTPRSAAF